MANIAALVTHRMEDADLEREFRPLTQAGHMITAFGANRATFSGAGGPSKTRTAKELRPDQFDALLVLGNHSKGSDERALRFVKNYAKLGRVVVSGANGIHLLIEANLLRSRMVACTPEVQKEVEHAGARCHDQSVCQDENLITCRASQLADLCRVLLDQLEKRSARRTRPSSVYSVGTGSLPELTDV